MEQQRGSNEGTSFLRKLRERKGWSQLELAIETGVIAQTNYSKIESGKTHPSHEKLQAILTALDATKNEMRDGLKFFGYLPATPLPNQGDIEAVILNNGSMLSAATVPVFLIDISTRLCHWNCLYEKLLGEEGKVILETMRGRPFIQMAFEGKLELEDEVENLDDVLLDDVSTTHRRLNAFNHEDWVAEFIDDVAYDTPRFEAYWQRMQAIQQETPVTDLSVSQPMPVEFNVPGILTQPLSFIGYGQPVPTDTRFQAIFLLPSEEFTLEIIEGWRVSMNTIH